MNRKPQLHLFARLALCALALAFTIPATAEQSRRLDKSFPAATGAALQIANLAGKVEIAQGAGGELKVEATIYAEGKSASQTQELLDGMQWVESHDRKGNPEWALSYPVAQYRSFAYPRIQDRGDDGWLWHLLSSLDIGSGSDGYYLGKRVGVRGRGSAGIPVLYADLKITLPGRGKVVVRNLVGDVEGGQLEGDLKIDTGSGDVNLAGFAGNLYVDTGSGDVTLGRVRGETVADTGSGNVTIAELIGNGNLDTGSGDIEVEKVAAGKLRTDTGSGNIVVRSGTVATLTGDTGSGDILVDNVEVEKFVGDTGSGDVTLRSSLAEAREVRIDTGSGDVVIYAGPDAAFDLVASQGSGDLSCGYSDATLRKQDGEVVGAERGNRQTRIVVDTGSGDCRIAPAK